MLKQLMDYDQRHQSQQQHQSEEQQQQQQQRDYALRFLRGKNSVVAAWDQLVLNVPRVSEEQQQQVEEEKGTGKGKEQHIASAADTVGW